MHWSVLALSVPFALYGARLIIDPNKNMDLHMEMMQNGKETIWKNDFRHEVGVLICELDEQINLIEILEQRREVKKLDDELEEEEMPLPDYSQKIGEEIAYTKTVRSSTEQIAEYAKKIENLEQSHQNIPEDRRGMGASIVSLVLGMDLIIMISSQTRFVNSIQAGVSSLIVVLLAGGYFVKRFLSLRRSRKQIQKHHGQHERRREI